MSHAQTILELRIRNLIAAREFNTAKANRELSAGGEWLWDHAEFDRQLAAELDRLLIDAEVEEED